MGANGYKTHGETVGVTNGVRKLPKEYTAWHSMKRRCYDPGFKSYQHYGGRGIGVCKRWLLSYPSFLQDMGRAPSPDHMIDRIDGEGDYTPENCRWVDRSTQMINRRNTVWVKYDGRRVCIAEAARMAGVSRSAMVNMIRRGEVPKTP